MKLWLVAIHIVLVGSSVWASLQYDGLQDNDFAEFEEFDTDEDEQTDFVKERVPDKEPEKPAQDVFQQDEDVDDVMVEVRKNFSFPYPLTKLEFIGRRE